MTTSFSLPLSRRSLLRAAAAAPVLSVPGILRAQSQTTLRFIPVIDLAFVDPVYSTAQVSRNHGFMVYDTLYGMNAALEVSPQMLSGHVVSSDELHWDLTLRDGLFWHDGERVLARDCVASIRRWAARDGFGGELISATDELSAPDDEGFITRVSNEVYDWIAGLVPRRRGYPMYHEGRAAAAERDESAVPIEK